MFVVCDGKSIYIKTFLFESNHIIYFSRIDKSLFITKHAERKSIVGMRRGRKTSEGVENSEFLSSPNSCYARNSLTQHVMHEIAKTKNSAKYPIF